MGRPEGNIRDKIKDKLNSLPQTRCTVAHGSIYSELGQTDIYGCSQGRAFFLEVKDVGKQPRKLQIYRLQQWKKTGAICGVVESVEEATKLVWTDQNAGDTAGDY